jgi:hypothetical protein
MWLAFAAPASRWPFEPTALASQHLLIELARAASCGGLPSLLTACVGFG